MGLELLCRVREMEAGRGERLVCVWQRSRAVCKASGVGVPWAWEAARPWGGPQGL